MPGGGAINKTIEVMLFRTDGHDDVSNLWRGSSLQFIADPTRFRFLPICPLAVKLF